MSHDSRYTLPSGVLRNKLGITDPVELSVQERALAEVRSVELKFKPIRPSFDLIHLKKIHKHLFQDIYDWAGELRLVNIYKGNSFCNSLYIESEADKLFTRLAAEKYLKGLGRDKFIKRLAYYFSEINALHPFRDGNGRTQRVFTDQLAEQAGYSIEWKKTTQEQMVKASVDSWNGDYAPMERLFAGIIIAQA